MSHLSVIPGYPAFEADEHTCALFYIMRRLGQPRYSDDRAAAFLEKLTEKYGFPPALPHMSAGKVITRITHNSRWIRDAVDQWFLDWLPPEMAAKVHDRARDAAAAEMDAAAQNLQLVGGRE